MSRGFSLIEFMVAILLGSILISGAVGVYLGSKRSYTEVEQVAALAENARFSLSVLEDSLRHVGFFGPAGPGSIALDTPDLAEVNDCGELGVARSAVYDLDQHFFGLTATSSNPLPCIGDALTNSAAPPDLLVIKHLAPEPLYDADPADASAARDGVISFPRGLVTTETYAIVNAEIGILFDGADTAPAVNEGEYAEGIAFPYRFNVYYVKDGGDGSPPVLARKGLQWDATAGAMIVDTQDLVEGVENMQLLYGVDSDGDGEVDSFVNDSAIGANDWGTVLAVRVFLLVQSTMADPDYTDTRSYRMGDIPAFAPGGNRRRLMVSTEITLRNPRLVLRGGA